MISKTCYKRLKGSKHLRQRLLLSTISSTPILVDDIRHEETCPGLRPHEISLLSLLEKISDNCFIEINETGTKLRYKPGIIMGGKNLVHECGLSRSIGYFLEPLLILAVFGKKPLSITLQGITNDSKDPTVDTFKHVTLNLLRRFGVPSEGLEVKIIKCGAPPNGGGEVVLGVPIVHNSLTAVTWIDEGMVKRIRGTTFSVGVHSQFENAVVHAARGRFDRLIPDVLISTDHRAGELAENRSPGYGISLVAETTSGCFISTDTAVSYTRGEDTDDYDDERKELTRAKDLGKQAASVLLGEIEQGGVVDSTHQDMLFLLCALCPADVSKVRVGKLSLYAIETLRLIKEFLGVEFVIKTDPATETVVLKCVGYGLKNLSRTFS